MTIEDGTAGVALPFADPPGLRLPTFLIIGANKAGTTSLFNYLGGHPDVYMSPIKEPHFFSYMDGLPRGEARDEATRLLPPETHELRTLEQYAALFSGARDHQRALGEGSTGYLCGPHVPPRVRQRLPDVKLVAILRDPAERAWSEYLMMRRLGQEPDPSLSHILATRSESRYAELGRYGAALDRWFAQFPADRMRVHLFEDFVSRTEWVVADILEFIGVDPAVGVDTSRRYNSRSRREPSLDARTRSALVELLEPDIRHTAELLGRDLSAWLDVRPPRPLIVRWLRGSQVANRS